MLGVPLHFQPVGGGGVCPGAWVERVRRCVWRRWPGPYPSSGSAVLEVAYISAGACASPGRRGMSAVRCCRRCGPIVREIPAASAFNMAYPEVSREVNDLLVEEDLEDDEAVPSLSAWPSYLASSPHVDAADGNPPRAATSSVPSARPSGGLMSVCCGTTAPSVGGQPRVAEPLPPPPAARLGASAGAGGGLSQDGPAGGDGGLAPGVGVGNSPSVMAGKGEPCPLLAVVPATVAADVPSGSEAAWGGPLESLPVAKEPLVTGVLPAVPRVPVVQDAPSPVAVDGGGYSGRGAALLLPPRPRAAVPVQVPAGLPPVPAVLPGPARIAPLGGGGAVTVGAPPFSVPDMVARVRRLSVKAPMDLTGRMLVDFHPLVYRGGTSRTVSLDPCWER